MLREIYIKNLAVIKEMVLPLESGLCVFTGETGAGKSIIIDAVNTVLGARTYKEVVRHGEKSATIIATFDDIDDKTKQLLEENGIDPQDGTLIFERQIFADGKSVSKLNSKPTGLALIKEIGTKLLNIHGQNDTLTLLSPQKHLEILDELADNEELIKQYQLLFREVARIKKQMNSIVKESADKEKKMDLLNYQIEEITQADIRLLEDETLESSIMLMKNSEKIAVELAHSKALLSGDDDQDYGVLDAIKTITRAIETCAKLYPNLSGVYDRLEEICYDLDDINNQIDNVNDTLDFDAAQLYYAQERLELINDLKSKYGNGIPNIYDFLHKAQSEREKITLYDNKLQELGQQGKLKYATLVEMAKKISDTRKSAALGLEKKMKGELAFLGMVNAQIEVEFTLVKPSLTGQDTAEIYIITNKGSTPKPMIKIASGGELSRIMLAFKNALSQKNELHTMIFDEIDSGVSGKSAQAVGQKLREVSQSRQVLCVTHSAQIAALADHQYLIKKDVVGDTTQTTVEKLDFDGRQHEIARIIGTDKVTDLVMETAKEMLEH